MRNVFSDKCNKGQKVEIYSTNRRQVVSVSRLRYIAYHLAVSEKITHTQVGGSETFITRLVKTFFAAFFPLKSYLKNKQTFVYCISHDL